MYVYWIDSEQQFVTFALSRVRSLVISSISNRDRSREPRSNFTAIES
jgi:hypothetical protein